MARSTIRITLTSLKDGGYILKQEVAPLWRGWHEQAFGWTEHKAILAVVGQMLKDIDAGTVPDE